MLDTLILGSNKDVLDNFCSECVPIEDMIVQRSTKLPSTLHELIKLLKTHRPHIVFLEVDSRGYALQVVSEIRSECRATCVIGFAKEITPQLRQTANDAGVDEVITHPFTEKSVVIAARRALQVDQGAENRLMVFQPARGGVGATHTALNTAWSLAHDFRKKVLFVEGDLHSGTVQWLADIRSPATLLENLETSHMLDPGSWQPKVTSARGLDWILSPQPTDRVNYSAWDLQRLIAYALRNYERIVIDLPEAPAKVFDTVAKHADSMCVVSRANPICLNLARRRLNEWEQLEADSGTLSVLVSSPNRVELSRGEMEAILRRPIDTMLPGLPRKSRRAKASGLVDSRSSLGKAYRRIAATLGEGEQSQPEEKPSWKTAMEESLEYLASWRLGRARA